MTERKMWMIITVSIGAFLLIILYILFVTSTRIEDAYESGYEEGKEAGYEIGFEEGYDTCHEDFVYTYGVELFEKQN